MTKTADLRASLNLEPDARPSAVSPGTTLIIEDGFYPDPDRIRREALQMEYGPKEGGNYAGRNATRRVLDPEVVERMTTITGDRFEVKDGESFGVFRLSVLDDPYGTFIHSDPVRWGGVLFLNPQPQSIGGTAFWRHRETGLEQLPWDDPQRWGFATPLDAWRSLVEEDGNHPERWELVLNIPARYNRLLLFNSRLFHSQMPYESFGTTAQTARLVQVFFFTPEPTPA